MSAGHVLTLLILENGLGEALESLQKFSSAVLTLLILENGLGVDYINTASTTRLQVLTLLILENGLGAILDNMKPVFTPEGLNPSYSGKRSRGRPELNI